VELDVIDVELDVIVDDIVELIDEPDPPSPPLPELAPELPRDDPHAAARAASTANSVTAAHRFDMTSPNR